MIIITFIHSFGGLCGMRRLIILSLILAALLSMAGSVLADNSRESKTVMPEKKVNLYRIPVDPKERAKALDQIVNNTRPGSGTFFMFNTRFTPSHPEQSSLRPGLLLNQPSVPPYTVQGYCMIRDSSGLRARVGGIKITNNQSTQMESIFAGGDRIYQWYLKDNDVSPGENVINNNYLKHSDKGIDYFLTSVKYRGIILGAPMEKLLTDSSARRIGVENIRGTRTLVYGIQPAKEDFLNGYQYMQVWLRVGDFRIIRSKVEKSYGTEQTEYSRHIVGIQIDDSNFLFPNETIDNLRKEYEKYMSDQSGKTSETPAAKPEAKPAAPKEQKPAKDSTKDIRIYPNPEAYFLP
jgi:hypothetical protein